MNKTKILTLIQDGYYTKEALSMQIDITFFELESIINDLIDEDLIEERDIRIPTLGSRSPQYKTILILTENGEELLNH